MSEYIGPIPTRFQIERQLKRMLESDIFKRNHSQAYLLEAMVKLALKKELITLERLRKEAYGLEYSKSLVRVQAANLGDTTAEYYLGPGQNDPVLIYLESWGEEKQQRRREGFNYMPKFECNLRHELTRDYLAACVKMNGGNLSLLPEAMETFSSIVEKDDQYADAWSALGDGYCWMAMLIFSQQPEKCLPALDEAQKCIETAAKLAPNSWHTHATKAFWLGLIGKTDESAREFGIARSLSRLMTEAYPPFLLLLAVTGSAEAVELFENRTLELFGNPSAQALYGRVLELSGQPDKAEKHFREALKLDPCNGLCHLAFSLLLQNQGRLKESKQHLLRSKVLLGPKDFALWEAARVKGFGPA